ncbi:CocE/NonD family hydrolase [Herbidospora galbida]|uniref:CocE/NonD family hydrolase n=1 Tax=Herbidospora galbida TaxID=2575442 RepID=A0A4U3MC35_9ACTN|nr:CocE/NonD family hydrolase [Herbidospora galbida]TKK85277.1 CocE/NonD family hydrolase [Herbidospora galbida]
MIDVPVDGLVADVFLPGRLPAPAVVVRTPYGTAGLWPEADALTGAGLAVVLQDLRGRHRSTGEFQAGADEEADGHTLLDWTTAQPWSDGTTLLYGTSYEAYAAWCAVAHPSVRGVASRQPWPPVTVAVDEELWWRTEIGGGRQLRPGLYDLALSRPVWPVPLGAWPPTPSSWRTQARRTASRIRAANVPSLHLGSWYCGSAATTLRQASLARRATVVMGGWASPLTHRLQPECAIDVPVDPDPAELALSWLAAVATGADPRPGHRCLVLGSNRWEPRDPRPSARPPLRALPLTGRASSSIDHDPADPYPSLPHSADLSAVGPRADVVRLGATGRVAWHGTARARCRVETDRPAELVATLVHETPAGVRTRLSDGTAPITPGSGMAEIRCAPVAVDLPAGHALHLELTVGRHPRHTAPETPVSVTVSGVDLLVPGGRR